MNVVLSYLSDNWDSLELDRLGQPDKLTSIVLTPRFRASAHLIFFIFTEKQEGPVLVAKVPRIPGDNARLLLEAENLKRVQSLRDGGFTSIPRVVANGEWGGNRLLVATVLPGQPMQPAVVRKRRTDCIKAVLSWLIDIQQASRVNCREEPDWYQRLAEQPVNYLATIFEDPGNESRLLDRLRESMKPLQHMDLRLVFEHGDLGSPNILVEENSEIGVVDWELSETKGLPAGDLFFFLTYIAFATSKARSLKDYVAAFDGAFFGSKAWAASCIHEYADVADLPEEAIRPLFMLYWGRHLARLLSRLDCRDAQEPGLNGETRKWLESNRYYALWKHAMNNVDRLGI